MKNTLVLTGTDNVAIALEQLFEGDAAAVYTHAGTMSDSLTVYGNIPRGHKIALKEILAGEPVLKYGFPIGLASKDIHRGEYVHVHNLESQRGRGDLQ